MTFIIYRDEVGQYRWHLKAANGRIIANSGEGYFNKSDCQGAITLVKGTNIATPVVDSSYASLLGR